MAGEWEAAGLLSGVGVSILISMRGRPPVNEVRLIGEGGVVVAA